MFDRTSKIIITFSLSALAALLFLIELLLRRDRNRIRLRGGVMLAMFFGTAGDLFLAGVFDGNATFYIGSLCFVAEHLLNGGNFLLFCRKKGHSVCGRAFRTGVGITALFAALLGILAFTVPEEPQTAMFFLILIYIAAIGFNLAMQFSFAGAEGGVRRLPALGMLLFLLSDYVIFLNLLDIRPYSDNLCWLTYIPGQALTILFCTGFSRKAHS